VGKVKPKAVSRKQQESPTLEHRKKFKVAGGDWEMNPTQKFYGPEGNRAGRKRKETKKKNRVTFKAKN